MNFPWEDVPRQISTNPAIWVCTVQSACSTWCDYGVAAHAKTWHLTQPHYQTLKGSSVTCSRSSLWSWLTVCNQQSDRKQEGFRFCSTSHSRVNTFYDSLKTFNFAVFSAVALRVCADVFPVSRFARQVNNDVCWVSKLSSVLTEGFLWFSDSGSFGGKWSPWCASWPLSGRPHLFL